jgi:hypothetical protein
MTATAIELHDYAATPRSMVPDVHPAAMVTIRDLSQEIPTW